MQEEHEKTSPQPNAGDQVRASWPFSLHDVRTNIAQYSQAAQDALVSAFLWCIDSRHPMPKPEFARRIGYSDNLVYKLYTGKYMHPGTGEKMDVPSKLVKAISEFLELEKERFQGGQTQFVLTPTARKFITGCDLARESQSPVFITGPSHIGKTWAAEYYTASNNHGRTAYARMQAASGLGGMVRRIATCVGVSDNANTAALVDRIKRALSPNMVLILDEVHLLTYTYRRESFFACLEVLREIYDEVQCGIVFSHTDLLLAKMREARNGELDQLFRRGVHRITLPSMPTKEDLTLIFTHHGLEFPAKELEVTVYAHDGRGKKIGISDHPYEVVRQLARQSGLKSITERLRYGQKLANKAQTKLAWDHFIDAHVRIAKQAQPTPEWE